MVKTLRSYFWWTYERGSFHYDVMVTLILAFIFVTPHLWDYRDRPQFHIASQVTVENNGEGQLAYLIRAEDVNHSVSKDAPLDLTLKQIIEPIAGDITIERYDTIKGPDGKVISYKVWAHR